MRADVVSVRAAIGKLKSSTKSDLDKLESSVKTGMVNLKVEVFRALWIQGSGLVGIQLAIGALRFAAIRFLVLK